MLVAKEMGWNGQGTKEDPITINSPRNIPIKMIFSNNRYYITFKKLNLRSLTLFKCKHVLVEDCKISSLNLTMCQKITVKSSSIFRLKPFLTRANNFENNKIYYILSKRQEKIFFRFFLIFTVFFSCSMIYFGIKGLFNLNLSWEIFYILIFGIMITTMISYYFISHFKIRKMKPNEFHKNITINRFRLKKVNK